MKQLDVIEIQDYSVIKKSFPNQFLCLDRKNLLIK